MVGENMRHLWQAAFEATQRESISDLVSIYEKSSLTAGQVPEECFEFLHEVFSNDELFNKFGMDEFVMETFTEVPRMTDGQKRRLLDDIRSNYARYDNLEFCWAVGDLISRLYEPTISLSLFRELFPRSTQNGQKGIALGLDVLRRHSSADSAMRRDIAEILESKGGQP